MKIFRVCRRPSLQPAAARFISRAGSIGTGLALKAMATEQVVDEVFNRPLPIPVQFTTRFGPAGLLRNVFYTSEKPSTTFYEFGFHLLSDRSLIGKTIAVALHELELISTTKPVQVGGQANHALLLDRCDYSHAHAWIKSLSLASLDTISYPNVREGSAGGGTNYAIYLRGSVAASGKAASLYAMTAHGDETVVCQNSDTSATEIIKPIMR